MPDYTYNNNYTHDLKMATNFENTMTMPTAGKPPQNVDYGDYNNFNGEIDNSCFDMPVAKKPGTLNCFA